MTQTESAQPAFEITTKPQDKPDTSILDRAILEAVDAALQTLGSESAKATYRILLDKFGIRKEDIPTEFAAFVSALEMIFGKAACLIEVKILEALHRNLPGFKFPADSASFSLVGYVEAARRQL